MNTPEASCAIVPKPRAARNRLSAGPRRSEPPPEKEAALIGVTDQDECRPVVEVSVRAVRAGPGQRKIRELLDRAASEVCGRFIEFPAGGGPEPPLRFGERFAFGMRATCAR
jgi:hypothetical protein